MYQNSKKKKCLPGRIGGQGGCLDPPCKNTGRTGHGPQNRGRTKNETKQPFIKSYFKLAPIKRVAQRPKKVHYYDDLRKRRK